jgi:hypothetical protein
VQELGALEIFFEMNIEKLFNNLGEPKSSSRSTTWKRAGAKSEEK